MLHSLKDFFKKKINVKFRFLNQNFKNQPFKLLDVGAGNHSATRTTDMFPNCEYNGLDIEKGYCNDDEDFKRMNNFYELDLTKLDYTAIPDKYYDAIIMTHVIEHLHNGDKVLPLLLTKLKSNGVMYIEYPGQKSTKLPSMYGTLNFYDDPTHVRIYSVKELTKLFEENNCQIIDSGTRRNYYYIFALPIRIGLAIIKRQKLTGNLFWDLLGFAEFLKIRKK